LVGQSDAVVAVVDTAVIGAAGLRYSSLLGGADVDFFTTLLVEDSGVITLAGASGGGFPGTPGAFDPVGSPRDVLVARIDPSGRGTADLHYVSYLGGPGGVEDWGLGLAWSHDGIVA